MQQTDSIQTQTLAGAEGTAVKHWPPTPAQIISWLPKDATPAQQDSAIQHYIKPKEIHWSQRPDTLHLPGHPVGKSPLDWEFPRYYKESFFSGNKYFQPEIKSGRQGIAGDPMPYTIAGDNFMTSLLLACFVLTVLAIRGSRGFVSRQLKELLYINRNHDTAVHETSSEIRFQLILIIEVCLMGSILFFSDPHGSATDTFIIGQSQLIFIFMAIFGAFLVGKVCLYQIVNPTFFGVKKSRHFLRAFFFSTSLLGFFLIPLVFVQSFFALGDDYATIYILAVLVLYYILLLYLQGSIFFEQKGRFLQNILYLCMLEFIPASFLWFVLVSANEHFKINF